MPKKSRSSKKTKEESLQVGNKKLQLGKDIFEMTDSTDLYLANDFKALRKRLEMEGFIWVRGVINRDVIIAARHAMLKQASKDGSLLVDDNTPFTEAINGVKEFEDPKTGKPKKKYHCGYCVNGITGCETNERENIDIDAWESLGPSEVMQNVYNGEDIKQFWKQLFGEDSMKPLVKQTFLRLVGREEGTIEHADYYYFKRDTHIFDSFDGQNAINASREYLLQNDMWDPNVFEFKEDEDTESLVAKKSKAKKGKSKTVKKRKRDQNDDSQDDEDDEDTHTCDVCNKTFRLEDLPQDRVDRLTKQDFGVEGTWHCPSCARSPMAIYTTWMCLSDLKPKQSVLCVCPRTHRLKLWDLPHVGTQLPGDFDWKKSSKDFPWMVPFEISCGDIILFNVKTIHAATKNTARPPRFRCSFDTRIQLVPSNSPSTSEDILVRNKMGSKNSSSSDTSPTHSKSTSPPVPETSDFVQQDQSATNTTSTSSTYLTSSSTQQDQQHTTQKSLATTATTGATQAARRPRRRGRQVVNKKLVVPTIPAPPTSTPVRFTKKSGLAQTGLETASLGGGRGEGNAISRRSRLLVSPHPNVNGKTAHVAKLSDSESSQSEDENENYEIGSDKSLSPPSDNITGGNNKKSSRGKDDKLSCFGGKGGVMTRSQLKKFNEQMNNLKL